jgi:catechol 2,3-dioxygenase-like lactoylglutathione lyase family enzyme
MLKHVAYVTMFVSDQDQALDFYTNVVGFEKRFDVPTPVGGRFLTIGVKGQDVALLLWPGTGGNDPGRGEATIEVEDCPKAVETLRSRGVKFDPPNIIELPFAWVARFEDPDGNRLQLRQGRQAAVSER